MKPSVSLYIIGYNEEANLRALLPTVKWADEILYVDSFSTDRTAEFCAANGIRHVNVPFEGFGKLRNRAIELTSHDWIVSIDTDERSTPEFAEEVRQTVAAPRHDAYFVPRHNTFLGRPLRHSGMYPDYRQPQVFRKDKLRYLEDMVHEGFECRGTVGHFKNYIWQHPWPSLKVLNAKSERYTTLMAQKNYETGRRASLLQLMVHPAAAFMKRYLFQLGFLDGTAGFVVAATHSHYTFMKYAKVWELRNSRKA